MRENTDDKVLSLGEEALYSGKVAAFLVAGGQGSRLGFDGPKGIFKVTPIKNKSLFQLFSEKLLNLQNQYKTTIPWYIMTSDTNHKQTIDFFEKNNYFKLLKKNIYFFKQDMLPAFDKQGKLIMEEKYRLFFSPNGHGGSLQALNKSGSLQDMQVRGVKYIFYFQVDNVLVNMCDPIFLGYHIAADSDMSTKVIRKKDAEEKMGVICKINGRDGVVEYSDLTHEDTFSRSDDGELKYWAGNTAIHLMNVDFLNERARLKKQLPYHKAEKNIPCIDEKGIKIHSDNKNGMKFETFIFDLLLDVKKSFTLEVNRKHEFSAVKNKDGNDSPKTARQDLLRNYTSWLVEAGIEIERNEMGLPKHIFEISPLFAQNAQDIQQKKVDIPSIKNGIYINGN